MNMKKHEEGRSIEKVFLMGSILYFNHHKTGDYNEDFFSTIYETKSYIFLFKKQIYTTVVKKLK